MTTTKKLFANILGLVATSGMYVLVAMPMLMKEGLPLPYSSNLFRVMLLWIVALPLSGFLIPGIIAIFEYAKNKSVWKYFYWTGWLIYSAILFALSYALANHSMN